MKRKPFNWKLFWCETEDHDEDWFIIAKTAKGAAREHEGMEGYDPGDATSEFVDDFPEQEQTKISEPGWPSHEQIEACGGVFIDTGRFITPFHEHMSEGLRSVKFGSRVFSEGSITDNCAARIRMKNGHKGN